MITTQTGPQPADFADVRATNLAVVLRHVRVNAPCSRADIAAATGLNKATVSSLVADLIDRRLLRESGLTERRIGRPATMLVLDGAPYAAIGLEIDADHLTAVAMDLAGERLLSWRRSLAGAAGRAAITPGRAVSAIAALATRAAARLTAQGRHVLRLTVGVPGLVGLDGAVRIAPNLGWRDVDLRAELVRALRNPPYEIAVENEANLAALAELGEGTARGFSDVLYVSGEIGVGAGLILGGELFRGAQGFGGEFGHMTLDPGGKPCACGSRGCLETVAGLEPLLEMAGLDPSSARTTTGSGEPVSALAARARAGDEQALAALREGGRWLGIAIASAANLLNFQAVVLGGFFGQLSTWLAAPIARELEVHVLASEWAVPRLLPSTLGPEAAVRGAAAQSLRRVLADPMAAA